MDLLVAGYSENGSLTGFRVHIVHQNVSRNGLFYSLVHLLSISTISRTHINSILLLYTRAAKVHLNFRAGSIFSVPVFTVFPGHWVNKADTQ